MVLPFNDHNNPAGFHGFENIANTQRKQWTTML